MLNNNTIIFGIESASGGQDLLGNPKPATFLYTEAYPCNITGVVNYSEIEDGQKYKYSYSITISDSIINTLDIALIKKAKIDLKEFQIISIKKLLYTKLYQIFV